MNRQDGFSAVELLITLFIAAIFLAAGYMLFSAIMRDAAAARQQAQASNIAYDYTERHAATADNPCAASTPLNDFVLNSTPQGLQNVRLTVRITCPYSSTPTISKISTTVRYGSNPVKEAYHAVYAAP